MSIFQKVVFPKHKRNVFTYNPEFRGHIAFGKIMPFFCEEVLPGDTWQGRTQVFMRAMPMLAPLLHRVNVYTHFFFVPYRLVWDNWKDFITGGEDGTAAPPFPRLLLHRTNSRMGSLADYLGAASFNPVNSRYVNALPFRAYNLIWNEYYRDQNLQEEINIYKGDGIDTITPTSILNRNWEKDYFTSALPWTQRGPEVSVPLAEDALVYLNNSTNEQKIILPGTEDQLGLANLQASKTELGDSIADLVADDQISGTTIADPKLDPNGTFSVDLRQSSGVNINELRRSIALQRWLETNARGGSRYIEQIYSHFGVKSSDARLQRPEFLGGGIQPLSISEVLQTSASTENSDLGSMAGHGISAATTKQFRKFFEEHGLIIGLISVMPKTSYMQGTRRLFGKFDRFDYYFPEFANLGEQEVWNSEIYDDGTLPQGAESGTFGYQSRYAEYKYIPNTVHGDLQSDAFQAWTLVRKFGEKPVLNDEFVELNYKDEDMGRIFPVTDSDTQFVFQAYHNFKAIRIMPKHVIPSI